MMSKVWRTPTSIQFAHDGLQGLIAMGEFQPNFVIVDLNIPLVDGFHLIKTLSAQFNANTQRYCVVTGLGHDEIHKRGELPKNCPIFGKPIDFPELEKLIAKAYSNNWAAAITSKVFAEENESYLLKKADLIKTESYNENIKLYLQEGLVWLKRKYGFNSRWSMQQYVKSFYDIFFNYNPDLKKYKI
jgi:DNA-binding response OmpR family regulator